MAQIGQRIRALREKHGLTQGDVERMTGMLRAYISRVELGHTVPSLETLERFAAVLNTPLHEMFHEGTKENTDTGPANAENPFLTLLGGYVRGMSAADREVLLALAYRLAKPSK